MSGTVESATATMVGVPTGTPGLFQYTITLTDTGTTTIGTFWFAWDDVPDQDFMTALPSNIGAPAGWTGFTTVHVYPGGVGYGIEWIASTPATRLNPGNSTSLFTFSSTETPTQMAAVSPFDNTFQTTSSFVYQTDRLSTVGGILVVGVACFREGTRIRTPSGDVAVETLRTGDVVVTASGEARRLRWTGIRRMFCARHEHPEQVWPVRVARDALAEGTPSADLYISPDHALFLDGVLVPVKYLINRTTIASVPVEAVTWYHLELDGHDVILAEGTPAESYLDTGDRGQFGGEATVLTHGAAARTRVAFAREAGSVLELIVTGPILAAIRERLARRGVLLTASSRIRNAA